jgi:hypothetical protein
MISAVGIPGRNSNLGELSGLFGHRQLPSRFCDYLSAIGACNSLSSQPVADRIAAQGRCPGALAFESLMLPGFLVSLRGLRSPDKLVRSDQAFVGEEPVFTRSLCGLKQMAKERFTVCARASPFFSWVPEGDVLGS